MLLGTGVRLPIPEKRQLGKDLLFDVVGCFSFSAAVQCFSSPNNIAPGGITGISILINYAFGLPISVLSFVLNVPLIILAWLFLGKGFTLKTLKSLTILSVMLQLSEMFLPVYQGEMILAALFGGVLEGIGLGLVFMRGSTTGGSDVASRLIQLRFPGISVGKLLLCVDGGVLLASAIVYDNIENALFGLIAIFTATRIIDSLLYGLDNGKMMMIVSGHWKEIAAAVNEQMGRGCTVLSGHGSYTGQERPVLLCVVRSTQFYAIKQLVYRCDPTAFLVALEANEILGEGFRHPDEKMVH